MNACSVESQIELPLAIGLGRACCGIDATDPPLPLQGGCVATVFKMKRCERLRIDTSIFFKGFSNHRRPARNRSFQRLLIRGNPSRSFSVSSSTKPTCRLCHLQAPVLRLFPWKTIGQSQLYKSSCENRTREASWLRFC
jgi:hypothetical protein